MHSGLLYACTTLPFRLTGCSGYPVCFSAAGVYMTRHHMHFQVLVDCMLACLHVWDSDGCGAGGHRVRTVRMAQRCTRPSCHMVAVLLAVCLLLHARVMLWHVACSTFWGVRSIWLWCIVCFCWQALVVCALLLLSNCLLPL